ncbi:MAG TPA: ergothioneine biosynthesis protein EgtC [Acidimicrobiales bacterium]|jgi:glutamine amidotransferase|nr:ergothioneine biosynthesis protein EgtC [Acidimicrobiales bacterium]
MCRFVAYLGPPLSLQALLYDPPHSLVRQSWAPRHQRRGAVNADGFGVGWYDHHVRAEPARWRTPRPAWAERSFASVAGLVRSTAVLAALRDATPPSPVEESGTPPFTAGPWLFAHNGRVDGFAGGGPTNAVLRRLVSDPRTAGIEGASDSEVLFALALDRLDAGADPGRALADVVATVSGIVPARLNLVLTDGHRLAATAWGESLFVKEGDDAVLVASEPHDDDGRWTPVPDGSLVVVDRSGAVVAPLTP